MSFSVRTAIHAAMPPTNTSNHVGRSPQKDFSGACCFSVLELFVSLQAHFSSLIADRGSVAGAVLATSCFLADRLSCSLPLGGEACDSVAASIRAVKRVRIIARLLQYK